MKRKGYAAAVAAALAGVAIFASAARGVGEADIEIDETTISAVDAVGVNARVFVHPYYEGSSEEHPESAFDFTVSGFEGTLTITDDGDGNCETYDPDNNVVGFEYVRCKNLSQLNGLPAGGPLFDNISAVTYPDEPALNISLVGGPSNDQVVVGGNITGTATGSGGDGDTLGAYSTTAGESWNADLAAGTLTSSEGITNLPTVLFENFHGSELDGFEFTGPQNDYEVSGTIGANVITTGNGDDVIHALDGNDTIDAQDFFFFHSAPGDPGDDDQIFGEGGNDVISASGGDDLISGGTGDDTIGDTVHGGTNSTDAGAGDDLLREVSNSNSTILMGADEDTVELVELDDEDDPVGSPRIELGSQDDAAIDSGFLTWGAQPASDFEVLGQDGDDRIYTGDGDDPVSGGAGADLLRTGAGADPVSGGDAADWIEADWQFFAPGPNETHPGYGGDDVDGDAGDDVLIPGPGADQVNGGADVDVILAADKSVDQVTCSATDAAVVVDKKDVLTGCAKGQANVISPVKPAAIAAVIEGDNRICVDPRVGTSGFDIFNGDVDTDGNIDPEEPDHGGVETSNVLIGLGDGDVLNGLTGDDCILGGDGVDAIEGGTGNDAINPGPGNDNVIAGDGDDVIDARLGDDIIDCGPGTDRVLGANAADELSGCEPVLDVTVTSVPQAETDTTFPLEIKLKNRLDDEVLNTITPINEFGFGIANSFYPEEERGQMKVVSGPSPAFPTSLNPGQVSTHTITMEVTQEGKVGVEAKASAKGADTGDPFSDTGYAEVLIGQEVPNEAERQATVSSGISLFLDRAVRELRALQTRYANAIFNALKNRLSDRAMKFYFGSTSSLKITETERALARLQGVSPEMLAISVPNGKVRYKDGNIYTTRGQANKVHAADRAQGAKYLEELVGSSNATAVSEWRYWSQIGSVEGRGQVVSDLGLALQGATNEAGETLAAGLVGALQATTAEGIMYGLEQSDAALKAAVTDFDRRIEARKAEVRKLEQIAETDPDAFLELTGQDNSWFGVETAKVLATLIVGEGEFMLAGKLYKGVKGSLMGVATAAGLGTAKKAKAVAKAVVVTERSAAVGPSYIDDLSDDAKGFISLREMENIGGMPLDDVATTKGIVSKVDAELRRKGYDIETEVQFRPANPFRVENAFAKVETVPVKTVTPMDLALGAPPKTLGETAVFNPKDPKGFPNFSKYPYEERVLFIQRYKTRLAEYNQYHGIVPVTDKKMKGMLKAFDDVHTFDDIGHGREIKMKLSTEKVGGATVFKYDYLEVQGKVLLDGKGKRRPIGTDYDQAAIIDKKTRRPLTGQPLSAAEFVLQSEGEKAALAKGYSNPFHRATAHATDASAADYPHFAFNWLQHVPVKDAIPIARSIAENYNRGKSGAQQITVAYILKKAGGLFDRHLLKVTASEASFGPSNVNYSKPALAVK